MRDEYRNRETREKAARARAFDERIKKGAPIVHFTFNPGMGAPKPQESERAVKKPDQKPVSEVLHRIRNLANDAAKCGDPNKLIVMLEQDVALVRYDLVEATENLELDVSA